MTENSFKCIVIAADGSEDAVAATRLGVELAEHQGSEIILVHAAAMPPIMPGLADPPPSVTEYIDKAAKQAIAVSEKVVTDHGLECESVIRGDAPVADVILDVAEERDADLIVVGHRGLGAVGRIFVGSVSNRIVHESSCPVLVAAAPKTDDD